MTAAREEARPLPARIEDGAPVLGEAGLVQSSGQHNDRDRPCDLDASLIVRQTIETHRGALRRRALHLSGNEQDAEDLVHDTVVKALEMRHQLRDASAVRAWLHKILFNSFLASRSRSSRIALTDDMTHFQSTEGRGDPEWAVLSIENLNLAIAALDKRGVSSVQKECYELAVFKGFKYKEIAEHMELKMGTVATYIARCRRIVMRALLCHAGRGGA